MARHIDADKIKYHKLSVCGGHGLNFEYTVAYKHEVDAITSAEVVSNDIFGLWKELAEKSAEEIETLKDTNEHLAVLLEEAKQDVAREIFEEIEKEVLLSLPVSSYIDAPRTTQNKIWNTIAELKKKYTGEKDNES